MKKNNPPCTVPAIAIALSMTLSLTLLPLSGCASQSRESVPAPAATEVSRLPVETAPKAEELLAAKNPYLGDAAADGRLVDLVKSYYRITEASTLELQTASSPYGLTLHFEKDPDNLSMQKTSAVLMALIDNCFYVSWDYPVDSANNKDYFYLSRSDASLYTDGTPLRAFAEPEADTAELQTDFNTLLRSLDSISSPCPARVRADTIEDAVSAAILEYNRSLYPSGSEAFGEGHLILDTHESSGRTAGSAPGSVSGSAPGSVQGSAPGSVPGSAPGSVPGSAPDSVTVYAQTMYGSYQFQDGNFVVNGGTGVIPAVIRLSREPDGTFVPQHYQMPLDGGLYDDSIKEMFPQNLWEQCLVPTDEVGDLLREQMQTYAEEYLQSIGREAAIGNFGDFPHTIPSDAGISLSVSDKLDQYIKYSENSAASKAPFWFGTVEYIEDGVRYIYEHSYDPAKQEIIYSKTNMETNTLITREIFDSVTGEKK